MSQVTANLAVNKTAILSVPTQEKTGKFGPHTTAIQKEISEKTEKIFNYLEKASNHMKQNAEVNTPSSYYRERINVVWNSLDPRDKEVFNTLKLSPPEYAAPKPAQPQSQSKPAQTEASPKEIKDFLGVSSTYAAPGRKYIASNKHDFKRVEKAFQVDETIIAAIASDKSLCGEYFKKPDAEQESVLTTYSRRIGHDNETRFSIEQMLYALQLVKDKKMDPENLIGTRLSGGAVGDTQFTPENIFKYGLNRDNEDKKINLFEPGDAIATTGNMLKDLGWKYNLKGCAEVDIPTLLQDTDPQGWLLERDKSLEIISDALS